MTEKLNFSYIRRIVLKDIAMGIESQPTQPEVRYYLRRGQYVIQDTGSKGYDLTVWNDDGYKMRVIAVADTDETPELTINRGGKL